MLREKLITIDDRDNRLQFRDREKPAVQLEAWTMRAALVLANAGSEIPADGIESAAKFLSEHGLAALSRIDYDKAKPLLDEMLGCCYRVMDKVEEKVTPETANAYVGDFRTLLKLRLEAFRVNFGFFGGGGGSVSPEKPNTLKLNAKSKA